MAEEQPPRTAPFVERRRGMKFDASLTMGNAIQIAVLLGGLALYIIHNVDQGASTATRVDKIEVTLANLTTMEATDGNRMTRIENELQSVARK